MRHVWHRGVLASLVVKLVTRHRAWLRKALCLHCVRVIVDMARGSGMHWSRSCRRRFNGALLLAIPRLDRTRFERTGLQGPRFEWTGVCRSQRALSWRRLERSRIWGHVFSSRRFLGNRFSDCIGGDRVGDHLLSNGWCDDCRGSCRRNEMVAIVRLECTRSVWVSNQSEVKGGKLHVVAANRNSRIYSCGITADFWHCM